jgi:F0F1-type ATP synthase membrane subunit b/b'
MATWFKGEMDYAGERLERAVGVAADRMNGVVETGIARAGGELRDVLLDASREVDAKLDKISEELHSQRSLTKDDVRELVDYAAEKLGHTIDGRIEVMKTEITELVQEKVEYLKSEVDNFFVQRQRDLARERRRLIANILIAVVASLAVAGVSLVYHRVEQGTLNLFGLFRVIFVSLTGGYFVYMVVDIARHYLQMAEHKKDMVFLAMRYWGVLRPGGILAHLALVLFLGALFTILFYPEWLARLSGSETLMRWAEQINVRPVPARP